MNTPIEVLEPLPMAARFEAGQGNKDKATHGSIEAVLETAGFRKDEIRAIYFGNWLRDYSQLLDPKIVRAASMPKSFPDLLSREALTSIVDVLAVREFTDLMKIDRSRFTVTPQRLGVYRPGEHIDNPKAINPKPANPRERDPDFEDWVKPGDPALQVDAQTSMKRYIQHSVEIMSRELDTATQAGPESTDGLRAFGAGLHILEDFFAHSNFVELSLIKLGHSAVLPWTSAADCKHRLPLVTGMFGGSDIIASLAAPLGKILFSTDDQPFEAIKAGARYERDQIILILLGEHPNEQLLQAYETFLSTRDQWASLPFSEQVERFYAFIGTPGKILGNAVGTAMQGLTTWIGNSIDDVQTALGDDPNSSGSTDPSHSQLAKDHAEHPLHALAALLAEKAVMQVGQAILSQWHHKEGAGHPAQVAAKFFSHPMDCDWQDELVRDWANRNPGLVKHATLKSELDHTHERLRNSAEAGLQLFNKESSSFLQTFFESTSLSDLWNKITGK
ncbi:Het-C domain-containing protein [Pseudomonas cichorii]|uniref:Het-C domain-containing protein n=1 Tax=Pseudomonas cichorii TaxID=36746 RepID=UPI00217F4AF7|nr:Het-C domain-containing protein [Pseudomonas cichorii]